MRRTWQTYHQPHTLNEAFALLTRHGQEARVIAGGTDLVVELSRGVKPAHENSGGWGTMSGAAQPGGEAGGEPLPALELLAEGAPAGRR